jgi:hypothetical protein
MRQRQCNFRRSCSSETGAAALEFALVLPLLVMLLFGIVEFAVAYNRVQGLHAAAREGARLAALPHATTSDVENRVLDALEGVLKVPSDADIRVSPGGVGRPCNLRTGDTVIVEVEYPHTIEIPIWGTRAVTLLGRGEFRCE